MQNSQQPVPQNWATRFFTIWTGQAFSLFGSALVQFALVWWLTQKTGSATILATASVVAMFPQIVLGPFVGALVDRWNRRWIMIVADGSIALVTLLLAYLFWIGRVEVWQIYAILFIRSFGGAFHWPAMSASTSLMVPQEQLARVAGFNQTLQGLMGIIAPPTGALLIGLFPTQGVLMIDVATAALAIVPLLIFTIPQPVRADAYPNGELKTSYWEDLRAGFRYMAAWPGLLAIGLMATIINFLLNPSGALMPLLVTKHFGLGALQFGLTDSLWGAGIIAGGILLGVWGGFKRKIVTTLMGIIGIGAGVMIVGIAPANMFWLALIGMALTGSMNAFANGPLMAILQSTVDPNMQGRVMSLINSTAMAMSPLSLLIAGPIADTFGIRTWYWLGGALCILMGLAGFFSRAVMEVETNHNGHMEVAPAAAMD
jgi:DHA3 family macrolide efflux protein-like MFS transporter